MCNNNCCMCCQCNNSTNNEETPQEVIYTSVCDSATCRQASQCNCNCIGRCENDPETMVLSLSEHMEECCEQVGQRITNLECQLEEEIERSTEKDTEHDTKIEDLYDKESLDYNNVNYELNNHNLVINFYHDETFQDKITIPVESFIKDWFVDDVQLVSGHILTITFNVDPATETHHEPRVIEIDLNNFLNPSNYYTKTEIDGKVNQINNNITNLSTDLNTFKTTVANTYETKVAAGNHITNVDYDQNDHHTLIFTKENGTTITKTIPDSDLYIQSGEYTGGNLVLTRNNNSTVTIPVPATNHIVGGSISGNVITLTRENNGTPVTIQLPADANTYPISGSVSNNVLTLTMSDNTTLPIQLPAWITTDNDHYPTAASLSGNTLTITGNSGFSPISVDLSQFANGADNDHYVTSAALSGNTLQLTRQGINGTVDVDLSQFANSTDNDHYVTSAALSGNTLQLTRDGISGTVDVDLSGITGTTNVTYGGNSVTIQNAINDIVSRIQALEGLWEVSSTDNTRLIAKSGRSAQAAGFYDSTVS